MLVCHFCRLDSLAAGQAVILENTMTSELQIRSASLDPAYRPPRAVVSVFNLARPFDLPGQLASLLLALPLALALTLPLASLAQPTAPMPPAAAPSPSGTSPAAPPATTDPASPVPGVKQSASGPIEVSAPVEGEVRKIEPQEQKLTLRHAPIPNLEIDDTVKEFRVADPVMLEDVKPGDRVRFTVERANGTLTVTALEPLRER